MKSLKLCLFLAAVVLLAPAIVSADGCWFSDYHLHLHEPSQKAIIAWDGSVEEMLLSAAVKSDTVENFAWVVPIQSRFKPEVEEGDFDIFYDVLDFFDIREGGYPIMEAGLMGAKDEGVTVVEQKEIDIYDVTILKATGADALLNWLNDNGYKVPDTAEPILQEYCNKPYFYFIALKIDLKNKHADALEILDTNFDITDPCSYIEIYGMGDTYSLLWEHIDHSKITDFEYDKILELDGACQALKSGAATPIKVSFVPKEPIYPLEISSLNEGYTTIEVYVVASTPIKDKNGVLSVSMTEATDKEIEGKLKEHFDIEEINYITRLKYSGKLEDLDADAIFVKTEQSFFDKVKSRIFQKIIPTTAKAIFLPLHLLYRTLRLID